MDNDVESIAAASIILAVVSRKRKTKNRKVRCTWVRPWLKRREELGVYDTFVQELRSEEEMKYQKFLRMSPDAFDELLSLIENAATKQDTVMRDAVPGKVKLAATIRYLVTGVTYSDLQYTFRIHKSTLSRIIPEVCDAIYARFKEDYFKVTTSF